MATVATTETRAKARTKINQWFQKELEAIRLRGAGEEVLRDPIVQILAFEASLKKHDLELLADQDLFDAMFLELLRFASGDDFRELADILFQRGYFDSVEDLNRLAQLKERGVLPGLLDRITAPSILCRYPRFYQ